MSEATGSSPFLKIKTGVLPVNDTFATLLTNSKSKDNSRFSRQIQGNTGRNNEKHDIDMGSPNIKAVDFKSQ